MSADDSLPDDVETLKLVRAQSAELAQARAEASSAEALVAHLRLATLKLRRELYGQRSERKARLLEQMDFEALGVTEERFAALEILPAPCNSSVSGAAAERGLWMMMRRVRSGEAVGALEQLPEPLGITALRYRLSALLQFNPIRYKRGIRFYGEPLR